MVEEINRLLDEILVLVEEGDREAAAELAAEAYLENYEVIEADVIAAAPEINDELEPLLGADLRAAITRGAALSEIEAMVDAGARAARRGARGPRARRGPRVRLRSLLAVGGLLTAVALTAGMRRRRRRPPTSASRKPWPSSTWLALMVDEAVRQYAAGDAEAAYTTARNAYLDHFEYVEIPLRVRDEGLTLALEETSPPSATRSRTAPRSATVRATAAELQRASTTSSARSPSRASRHRSSRRSSRSPSSSARASRRCSSWPRPRATWRRAATVPTAAAC